MLARFGLRIRIFLFFALLALGGAMLAAVGLYLGWSRAEASLPASPFLTAFITFGFLNTGLVLGIWLLFDENVAKPINALSAGLRLGAHSGVKASVNSEAARYLGDLAPAAEAMTNTVHSSVMDTAARVASETQRLRAESERLITLLTESPVATILLNPAQEIVLYDGQAADILSEIAQPRLKAPLSDYFDPADLAEAMTNLSDKKSEVPLTLHDTTRSKQFDARLKALGGDGHMVFIDAIAQETGPIAPRPLVFDFDLMNTAEIKDIRNTPLLDLCFVPFDTETTGLSVEKDAIVQLGAVRVLNGRIVEGEVFDSYVNPGRPIPAASSRIHRVTDDDVAAAPDVAQVGRAFHHFARDAVLVAHNAPFDIGLLQKSEREMGVEWGHPVLDTVLISAVVFGTNEEHSLDVLCERLAVNLPEEHRHTALGDARATAEVLVLLLPLLEGKGIRTFGQLVEATQRHGRLLQDMNTKQPD